MIPTAPTTSPAPTTPKAHVTKSTLRTGDEPAATGRDTRSRPPGRHRREPDAERPEPAGPADPGADDLLLIAEDMRNLEQRIAAFMVAHPQGHRCPCCDRARQNGGGFPGVYEELVTIRAVLWSFGPLVEMERPPTAAARAVLAGIGVNPKPNAEE